MMCRQKESGVPGTGLFENQGWRETSNMTGMRVLSSVRERRVVRGYGTNHPITYGDNIRVTFNVPGEQPLIFSSCELRDMTEVLGEVRRRTRGRNGLGQLWVMNLTAGWKVSRPLRLAPRTLLRGFGNILQTEPLPVQETAAPTIMPWDTH